MDRLKVKVAVYMILLNHEGKVLFGRRTNTGWQDGKLSLPSGHVDPGELPTQSALRELKEEVDIKVELNQLEIKQIAYRKDNYIDFYFLIKNWTGDPSIMEPSKCSELIWVDINDTKDQFAPNVLIATQRALKGSTIFSEFES